MHADMQVQRALQGASSFTNVRSIAFLCECLTGTVTGASAGLAISLATAAILVAAGLHAKHKKSRR